jgi:hypothetical protein
MPLLRTLAHLMLVLALLAGGVAPGAAFAQADAGVEATMVDADMAGNCHDLAGDPVGPPEAAPADCCDGGCACDCLHPAHVGLLAAPRLAAVTVREAGQRPFDGAMPTTRAAPEGRPPIA